jgi:hypothetical protein
MFCSEWETVSLLICPSHGSTLSSLSTWVFYVDIFPSVTKRREMLVAFHIGDIGCVCKDYDNFKALSAEI